MGVPGNDQVITAQVCRQVFLFMRHIDMEATQFEVQRRWQVLGPVFVVVAAYYLYRCYLFQLSKDLLAADVSGMENAVATLKLFDDFWPEQIMSIRDDACFHTILSPFCLLLNVFWDSRFCHIDIFKSQQLPV